MRRERPTESRCWIAWATLALALVGSLLVLVLLASPGSSDAAAKAPVEAGSVSANERRVPENRYDRHTPDPEAPFIAPTASTTSQLGASRALPSRISTAELVADLVATKAPLVRARNDRSNVATTRSPLRC